MTPEEFIKSRAICVDGLTYVPIGIAISALDMSKEKTKEEIASYLKELIENNKGKSYSETFLPPLYAVLGFINSKKK
jgi:hypothetical protein